MLSVCRGRPGEVEPATGHPDEIMIDGTVLRDRVLLDPDLSRLLLRGP